MNILILYNTRIDLTSAYHLVDLGVGFNTLNLMELIIVHNDKYMSIAKNRMSDDTGQLLPEEMLPDYINEWVQDWHTIHFNDPTDDDDITDWGDDTKNIGG